MEHRRARHLYEGPVAGASIEDVEYSIQDSKLSMSARQQAVVGIEIVIGAPPDDHSALDDCMRFSHLSARSVVDQVPAIVFHDGYEDLRAQPDLIVALEGSTLPGIEAQPNSRPRSRIGNEPLARLIYQARVMVRHLLVVGFGNIATPSSDLGDIARNQMN